MPDAVRLQQKQQKYNERKEHLVTELENLAVQLKTSGNQPIAQEERKTIQSRVEQLVSLFNSMDSASYELYEEQSGTTDRLNEVFEKDFSKTE